MGTIGGLLGLNGGAGGSGFSTPENAQIYNPTNPDQIQNAYANTQGSLGAQQQLLTALQGQNGLGNQGQVYGQLQGVANGTGPNPAQAMLNQATGANVANQAALMAGQRGAGSNVGLIARQAAQQGAGIQQNAAGQAATLQANQSLNALNSAGSLANTQAANQIGQTNANTQAQQASQQSLLNAQQGVTNATVSNQGNVNNANTSLANTTMAGQQGLLGGLMNAAGAAAAGAGGGEITSKGFADGGDASAFQGPQSRFGQFLIGNQASQAPQTAGSLAGNMSGEEALNKGMSSLNLKSSTSGGGLAGGPMDNMGGAGIGEATMVAACGGEAKDYRSGGKVNAGKGQKAVAAGNSYANDKIPALLSEHEIVLPREVTMSADPVAASAKFVASVIAKRKAGK